MLKHVLILIVSLSSVSFSLVTFYQNNLHLYQLALLTQKQKAVEIILYSYFMAHLQNNISKQIQTTDVNLSFTIEADEATSRLTSQICFNSCYEWKLEYSFEEKQITNNQYLNNENTL